MPRANNTKRVLVLIVAAVVGLIVLGGLVTLAILSPQLSKLLTFYLDEYPVFILQLLGLTLAGLLAVYISQIIRNQDWFDKYGAALEMGKVQARIGKSNEKAGDSTAVAIQYTGTTLFIALVVLSFFLMHGS